MVMPGCQIDYLGGMPLAVAKPVKTSPYAEDMLRFDLENENETIVRYRQRVRQCEALGEYAMAEQIRDILVQEQDHQIALATALGLAVPNLTSNPVGWTFEGALASALGTVDPDATLEEAPVLKRE